MFSEIPSSNEFTQQAFQFRKEGRYAAHPVEAALRYHRAQAENTGAQSHGGFDFESAEILYRAGAQGLRFSEIPQLPQSIPELSRLASVDRSARSYLRHWVDINGPVYEESIFIEAWESQEKRGGAEHHVHHDQEQGRWFKRLHRSLHFTTLGDYFDRLRLHEAIFEKMVAWSSTSPVDSPFRLFMYSNDSKPGKKSDRIIENDGACVAVGLGPFQGSSAQPTAMGKKGVFILLDQCRILFLLQFAEVGKQALEIN